MKPLKDYVILEEIKKELSKVILISDKIDIENHQAEVISVGSEVKLVVPGDKVLIKNYGFDEIEFEGKVYKVGKEEGIYAII